MSRLYLAYGLLVVGLMGVAEYRGWSLAADLAGPDRAENRARQPGLVPCGVRTVPTLQRRKVMDMAA